jgi:hypothetical protein
METWLLCYKVEDAYQGFCSGGSVFLERHVAWLRFHVLDIDISRALDGLLG